MENNKQVILISESSSNTGKVKIIVRIVKEDNNGQYVLHKGRKAYLIKNNFGDFVIDYWMNK